MAPSTKQKVCPWWDRVSSWIDAHPRQAFGMLTVLYLIVVISLSSIKLLWLDELITLHIARLGSASSIWHALWQGADPNPPLTHIVVGIVRRLLGEREYVLRLPAMFGYWIGMLSLFSYLRSRVSSSWAIAGTSLSLAMAAFDYSYESRSYGIFYGLAMASFLFWTRAVESRSTYRTRQLSFLGMTVALAAGISTNYFAVLAFIPIFMGEAASTLVRITSFRPIRWTKHVRDILWESVNFRVWICLGLAASPLILFRGPIEHNIHQFAPYAWNKVSLSQVCDSYTQMVEYILYPILGLLILAFGVKLLRSLCPVCRSTIRANWLDALVHRSQMTERSLPFHEAVGICTFILYPVLGYAIASVHGGMLSPRFVIPVCYGFAIAAVVVSSRLFGGSRRIAIIFIGMSLMWFLARESYMGYWYSEQRQSFYKIIAHLPEAERYGNGVERIVIPDPLLALTFQHYAPPSVARRIVFPIDFPAVRFYRGDDSPEENLWAGRDFIYTLPIVPLATFQHSVDRYLVIAGERNWLIEDLHKHNYPVIELSIDTRAGAMGGFTPLSRGKPSFYLVSGDQTAYSSVFLNPPIAFNLDNNLPSAEGMRQALP